MNCPLCMSANLIYYRADQNDTWRCECDACNQPAILDHTNSWIWHNPLNGDILAMRVNTTKFRNGEPLLDWEQP